jgi:hypothetical protein
VRSIFSGVVSGDIKNVFAFVQLIRAMMGKRAAILTVSSVASEIGITTLWNGRMIGVGGQHYGVVRSWNGISVRYVRVNALPRNVE